MLQVSEIFRSIQGESTQAGRPCVFVRLAGCNLRCSYCDTRYAQDSRAGRASTVAHVVRAVLAYRCIYVTVTGGEPLLQSDALPLSDQLAGNGCEVGVETNGSVLLPGQRRFRAVVDLKCPGSGEADSFRGGNRDRLRRGDEVKLVVCDRADFEWGCTRLEALGLPRAGIAVLFSPARGSVSPPELADWILDSGLDVRLQLQLHHLVWPGRERGR